MRRPPLTGRDTGGAPPRLREDRTPSPLFRGKSLAADVRALPAPRELDDVHMAQIRQLVMQSSSPAEPPFSRRYLPSLRTALFALIFLTLGSLATALAARPYLRRLQRASHPPAEPLGRADGGGAGVPRTGPHRLRMAIRDSAEIEVAVAPGGTEISVLDGRAELTGPTVAGPVVLLTGGSWREANVAETIVPPPSADAAKGTVAPEAAPEPSAAAAVAVDGARSPSGRQDGEKKLTNGTTVAAPARGTASRARPMVASLEPIASLAGGSAPPPAWPQDAPAPPPSETPSAMLEPPPFAAPATPAVAGRPSGIKVGSVVTDLPRGPARALVSDGSAEAFLLTAALRALRVDGRPAEALEKLDEHRARFPGGMLQREAALARVEALLKLGRRPEALQILDSMNLGPGGGDRAALLARGELRADGNRCGQARQDFDQLLLATRADDVAERALYARAHCATRAHAWDNARADLREHMTRFPDGRRSAAVQALLRQLPASAGAHDGEDDGEDHLPP